MTSEHYSAKCICGKIEPNPSNFVSCEKCKFKRYCSQVCLDKGRSTHDPICNEERTNFLKEFTRYMNTPIANFNDNNYIRLHEILPNQARPIIRSRHNILLNCAKIFYEREGNKDDKYQVMICELDRKTNIAKLYIPKNLSQVTNILKEQSGILDNYKDSTIIVYVENNKFSTIAGFNKITSFNRELTHISQNNTVTLNLS